MRSDIPPARTPPSRPLLAPLLLAALLAAGCVYRLPIQQGNLLDPTQVEQLQEGMTRSQVAYLLGTPMVPSGFNNNRWDYLYYVKVRVFGEPFKRRLTVWFEDDKVLRFERENMDLPQAPAAAAPAAEPPADVAAPAMDPTLAPSAESATPASKSSTPPAPPAPRATDKGVDQ